MTSHSSCHKIQRVFNYLSTARDFVMSNGASDKQKALIATVEACIKKAEFLYMHDQGTEADALLETAINQVDTLYAMN